jgi:hypothetical protein
MPDEPPNERFHPVMPRIPGVTDALEQPAPRPANALETLRRLPPAWLAGGAAALVLLLVVVAWMLRGPSPTVPVPAEAPVPAENLAAPEAAPAASAPASPSVVTAPNGAVEAATLEELARPWAAKKFTFRRPFGGETVPAIVVRLPGGGARRAESYWAFAAQNLSRRCELEFVTDLARLAREFGYRARHPMVVDPCDGTVFDPLQYGEVSGVWVRGEAVHGPAIRPPLAIEVRIEGNRLLATRME